MGDGRAPLADRFGQAVQVRRVAAPEHVRRRELLTRHERVGQVRLGILLLGVEQVAGEPNVGMVGDPVHAFVERGARLADQAARDLELAAVNGPDRVRGGADRTPGGREGLLACGGLRVEALVERVGEVVQVHLRRWPQTPTEAASRTTTWTGSSSKSNTSSATTANSGTATGCA